MRARHSIFASMLLTLFLPCGVLAHPTTNAYTDQITFASADKAPGSTIGPSSGQCPRSIRGQHLTTCLAGRTIAFTVCEARRGGEKP